MTHARIKLLRFALAAVAGVGCLFASDRILSPSSSSLITEANAIIGRPLTPMSYAGVARRTTGRAVVGGAAVGVGVGVAAGAAAVAPRCVQVADAYGRIVTRCY
jgi:uncharacterized protein (DUF697 family)